MSAEAQKLRLDRLLANMGYGSRKEIAALVKAGRIMLDGQDIYSLNPAELREIRGRKIAMVFQEPLSALNPSWRVGDQIAEVLCVHRLATRADQLRVAAVRHIGDLPHIVTLQRVENLHRPVGQGALPDYCR